jgi:hypothetical protein
MPAIWVEAQYSPHIMHKSMATVARWPLQAPTLKEGVPQHCCRVLMMMCYKPKLVGPYGPEGSRTTAQIL